MTTHLLFSKTGYQKFEQKLTYNSISWNTYFKIQILRPTTDVLIYGLMGWGSGVCDFSQNPRHLHCTLTFETQLPLINDASAPSRKIK